MKKLLFLIVMIFMTCSTWRLGGPPIIQAELTGPWVSLPPPIEEQLKKWPNTQHANMIEYIFKDVAAQLKKIDWSNQKIASSVPTLVGKYIVEKYKWPKENYYANIYGYANPFRVEYFLLQLKDKDGEVWELKFIITPE